MLTLATFLFAFALATQDPAPGAEPAPDEIVVTGRREGTLDLDRLLAARGEFAKYRPTYAPDSRLWFVVSDTDRPIRLTLRDGDRSVAVPVDDGGRFALDAVPEGKWELLHDRGKRPVRLRALVLSPNATEDDRPLGDMRLQCRVFWKLEKGEVNFAVRALGDTLDICNNRRVGIYFGDRRVLVSATVDTPAGPRPLKLSGKQRSFEVPLSDRTLPNDARVRIAYR